MLTIVMLIKKLIKYLNSNESIENIALTLTLSILYALTPFNIWFHLILFGILILKNGNLFIFLLITPIFSFIAPITYNPLHILGDKILTSTILQPWFHWVSAIPLTLFLNWNNTVQLAAYIISIIICVPLYITNKKCIISYRSYILPQLQKYKITKMIKLPGWIGIFFKD
jgi:uncharacterized protein (TIGR03546 family)